MKQHKCNLIIGILLAILVNCTAHGRTDALSALTLPKVISADQAFTFNLSQTDTSLSAQWQIAPHCYLYQDKLHFTLLDSEGKKLPFEQTQNLPQAQEIDDPYFGRQGIYRQSLIIPLSLAQQIQKTPNTTLSLQIDYQGCAETGFCYPPISKWFLIRIANHQILNIEPQIEAPIKVQPDDNLLEPPSITAQEQYLQIPEASNLAQTLKDHHVITAVATFYFLGILLTFTPCILPMIPILFGVIVGQKHLNTRKAFWLSLSYVLSMALTYALAGVIVATLGKNLQAYLQQPAVIISFAALFAYFGFAQIGIMRINFAHGLRFKELLTKFHAKQESGTYVGAAIMGVLATLISSPCVTAPLIGALSYISQSGNVILGGGALLAMGLGMGTILLAMGTLGGKYIPKSGAWMHAVNQAFAVVMFGLSIWLLDRIFHGPWILVLWGGLCLFTAWCMKTFHSRCGWSGRFGVLLVLFAGILFWGAWQGKDEIVSTITSDSWNSNFQRSTEMLTFHNISSNSDLSEMQAHAKKQDIPLMLVFYADWCISCRHLEHTVFNNKVIQQQLENWELVRADITRYNQEGQLLLQRFDLIGPPAVLFFDRNGIELTKYRIIGESSPQSFSHALTLIKREMKAS